jgi:TNF receptor-associated protein 1
MISLALLLRSVGHPAARLACTHSASQRLSSSLPSIGKKIVLFRQVSCKTDAFPSSIPCIGNKLMLVRQASSKADAKQSESLEASSADAKQSESLETSSSADAKQSESLEASSSADAKQSESVEASDAKQPESLEFQAETRQLLDIVTNSLYTDKEVFLRELVSNASDSLEKLRHLQATNGAAIIDPDLPLEIRIDLDEVTSSISVSDTGIGLTRDEMVSNLGTIARSGSKKFVKEQLERIETGEAISDPARGIIGKFGVGFYSAFMVGEKIDVKSRSALLQNQNQTPKLWSSEGGGVYEISDLQEDVRQNRGSSIVVHLKDGYWDYVDESRIEKILKKYSNFINFPIYLNGNRVNTLDAIWAKDPKEVQEDDYVAFYKYIANAIDDPLDTYHFRADAPIDVKAVLFIPSFHSEKYGMGRMEPGVALYCRKILIENKSPDILPDWLRFVKGVVDSEDLPLAISREKSRDSALVARLRKALTRKYISHLAGMMKNDRDRYLDEFYREYCYFLKEGICQDYEFQSQLAKLLFFETSKNTGSKLVSLDEYIGRMRPEQKDVYYLVAPSREAALNSPYLEAFEKSGVEVLLLFTSIDDFVMANLELYENRKLVSVDKGEIDLTHLMKEGDEEIKENQIFKIDRELSKAECAAFCEWFCKELGDEKVASCVVTDRLTTSPAIVTDNESGVMRRMMRFVDTGGGSRDTLPLPKQNVEINPKHPVIVGIHDLVRTEPTLARVLGEQVFDNCLISAGLLDDSRSMLPRLNDILLCVVNSAKAQTITSKEDRWQNDLHEETPSNMVERKEEGNNVDEETPSYTVERKEEGNDVDEETPSNTVERKEEGNDVDEETPSNTVETKEGSDVDEETPSNTVGRKEVGNDLDEETQSNMDERKKKG